jgi:hypothetical protein
MVKPIFTRIFRFFFGGNVDFGRWVLIILNFSSTRRKCGYEWKAKKGAIFLGEKRVATTHYSGKQPHPKHDTVP